MNEERRVYVENEETGGGVGNQPGYGQGIDLPGQEKWM